MRSTADDPILEIVFGRVLHHVEQQRVLTREEALEALALLEDQTQRLVVEAVNHLVGDDDAARVANTQQVPEGGHDGF